MRRFGSAAVAAVFIVAGAAPIAQAQTAAQPDPARMELARKLVDLSGGRGQAEAQVKAVFEGIKRGVAQAAPGEQATRLGQVYDALGQEMTAMVPQMLDLSAKIYATNLTTDELDALIAFQSSTTGQAIIHKMPVIQRQVAVEMMPMIMTRMPAVMRGVVDRVCEQDHCTTQQHDAIVAALSKTLKPAG